MNNYLFSILHNLSDYFLIKNIALFFSYIFIYFILLFTLFWILYNKKKVSSLILLFISLFSTWFFIRLLKIIFALPRPVLENPLIIEKGFSFPSEHSAFLMALAIVILYLNKKLGIFFILFALLIGLSRIVLGVHYPIDVFFGWLIGWLFAFIIISFFKKNELI